MDNGQVILDIIIILSLVILTGEILNAIAETTKSDSAGFEQKRNLARTDNPTYISSSAKEEGGDLYQPYYVCGNTEDPEGMTASAWHYSCKQSCTENNRRQKIDITQVRWDYVGNVINVYRVATNKVCYTSHMNVWGHCSQTQTSTPIPTEQEYYKDLPEEYFRPYSPVIEGTKYIVNSKEAECYYFSDNTLCERDYIVTYREGRTSQRSEEEPLVLNIYADGVRTDPYTGYLILNDVAWFWQKPNPSDSKVCGWKKMDDITCTFTETAEIMKCDTIGYTYNIQNLDENSTCIGKVYDTAGPVPFIYKSQAYYDTRESIVSKASSGKSDPDVNFIQGVNLALSELESTYCSATCDLFARRMVADDDHVLDTPIGTWRVAIDDRSSPKFIPCVASSSWKLKEPTSFCVGKNNLLVEDSVTKHTNSWNTLKDYIILNELCTTSNNETEGALASIKDRIKRKETIVVDFWNGDALVLEPPYTKPRWNQSAKVIRQNPSWFSKVKLDSKMLHTKENISALLTRAVGNVVSDVSYKDTKSKTVRTLMWEEIGDGIGNIAETAWSSVKGIFGGFTKAVVLLTGMIFIYIGIKLTLLIVPVFRGKPVRRAKRVSFEDEEEYATGTTSSIKQPVKLREKSRFAKRELANLLT